MNIKKIAEGKFLLVIKSLGIKEEFCDDREAMRGWFGVYWVEVVGKDREICLLLLYQERYN